MGRFPVMNGLRRLDLRFLSFAHGVRMGFSTLAIIAGVSLILQGRPVLGYCFLIAGTLDL